MKLGIRELIFVMLMIGLGACSYLFVFKPAAEKRAAQEGEMAGKRKALNDLRQSTADISNLEKKIESTRSEEPRKDYLKTQRKYRAHLETRRDGCIAINLALLERW